jgi:hypothetical protein
LTIFFFIKDENYCSSLVASIFTNIFVWGWERRERRERERERRERKREREERVTRRERGERGEGEREKGVIFSPINQKKVIWKNFIRVLLGTSYKP